MDSMGKIPSGIFDGTIFDFGEYDQCLQSQMPATPSNPELIIKGIFLAYLELKTYCKVSIEGKYCLGGLSSKELVDRFSYSGATSDKSKTNDKIFGKKGVRLISREAFNDAISRTSKDSGIQDNLLDFSTIMDFTYRGNGLPISVCIPETCSALEVNDFLNKSNLLIFKIKNDTYIMHFVQP